MFYYTLVQLSNLGLQSVMIIWGAVQPISVVNLRERGSSSVRRGAGNCLCCSGREGGFGDDCRGSGNREKGAGCAVAHREKDALFVSYRSC